MKSHVKSERGATIKTQSPTIHPFKMYYATIDKLDSCQLESYRYISEQILHGNEVDVNGNVSYLFVFLFEATRGLLQGRNYADVVAQISQLRLQRLYIEHSGLRSYCERMIAGILLCLGNEEERTQIIRQIVTGETVVYAGEVLINLKIKFGGKVLAKDLVSVANRLTSYGKKNIDDVLKIMDVLLDEAYKHHQFDIIGEIVAEESIEPSIAEELRLFGGNPYDWDLDKALTPKDLRANYVSFSGNTKFISFVEELSRVSENMLRESKGLPRVNEGWINEAQLYYSIKEAFPQFKVIHQYRSKWLGLQSLDIFIEELNIGIEYQGAQHIKPVAFFGGEEAFKKTQQRDKRKKSLCVNNGVELIYVYENYDLQEVTEKIRTHAPQDAFNVQTQTKASASGEVDPKMPSVNLKNLLSEDILSDEAQDERYFLDLLCEKLKIEGFKLSLLKWNRMGDKTLNVTYNKYQIGRIKLLGHKTKMQIIYNDGVRWIEDEPLEIYVQEQGRWIEYLKTLPMTNE